MHINKNISIGVLITLSGSIIYVLMGVLSKHISHHLSINEMMFLQCLAGLLCAYFFIKTKKYSVREILFEQKPIYLLRMGVSLLAIYAFIYGLQYLSIFNALVVLNSAPLVIPLLRRIFFKKAIHWLVFPAIILAFTGVVFILSPDSQLLTSAVWIVVFSMLCMSFSLLILEKGKDIDPNLSIFYYFFYSTAILAPLVFFQEGFDTVSGHYISLGLLAGVLFFLVQMSVIYGSLYITSQLISVLFYTEIILSLFASILFEHLQISADIILGSLFVIVGGIAVISVEKQSQLE